MMISKADYKIQIVAMVICQKKEL